jgi:outer membrane protein insertion porin family
MKNKIIKFICLVSLLFSIQGLANPINKIDFIGLNVISSSTLMAILPVKIGDQFNQDTSDEIIQTLFNTGYFSDISVSSNDDNLTITLVENPYIKYFNVSTKTTSGWLNWFSNEQEFLSISKLEELVESNELSAGNIFTKLKLTDFISSLKAEYIASGYYNVQIEPKIDLDSQNRIGIDLNINQGKRATISSMTISGAAKFSEKELLDLFTIGEADFMLINLFTNKDHFTNIALNHGLELMTNHYFNSGYLDFKVIDVISTLDDIKEKLNIDIQISEGIQYKLGKISFEGELGNQTAESLNELLSIKSGDIFNRQSIVNDIQIITDVYSDQGYAFANINPITQDFLDAVNVKINISLNKKVYVNRITISGNTRTQDEVIRREIGISEGGLYSRTVLRNSILNLRRLGYFSDVQMSASEVEGIPDKIDLNFVVEETKTGAISFSVSHSNSYGISVGAGIQEKNIFGSGNTLNTQLKLSESFNKLSFYFENPYFNDENHSISYGAFISEINDNDVMSDSYEISTKGLSLGYGFPLTENTRINGKLEYAKNDITCGSGFSASGYEPNQCATSSNDEVVLSLNWSESTLNDYMYPTEGNSNAIGIKFATPLGDYRYFNIDSNHISYKPLGNDLTMKLTADLGLAKGYSGNDLPFFKRYFGGGSGSVRGFGNKTLGPLYPNGKSKGGELSILGSVNIISPAYFFDDSDNMRMSAFIDTGNIFEKTSNIELGDLRMSAGIGFAYLSPIGAIGMYLSTPILKKSGDIIENFGFSLGTGF